MTYSSPLERAPFSETGHLYKTFERYISVSKLVKSKWMAKVHGWVRTGNNEKPSIVFKVLYEQPGLFTTL